MEGVEGNLPGVGGTGTVAEGGNWGESGAGKRKRGHSLADGGGTRGALRALGTSGAQLRRLASCPRGRFRKAKVAARTYPVDLRKPPLLPGFEQAERLPS